MPGQLRRTKILATLGPATDAPGALEALVAAGVDAVRINFSHGNRADHAARVARVRAARPLRAVRVAMVTFPIRGKEAGRPLRPVSRRSLQRD